MSDQDFTTLIELLMVEEESVNLPPIKEITKDIRLFWDGVSKGPVAYYARSLGWEIAHSVPSPSSSLIGRIGWEWVLEKGRKKSFMVYIPRDLAMLDIIPNEEVIGVTINPSVRYSDYLDPTREDLQGRPLFLLDTPPKEAIQGISEFNVVGMNPGFFCDLGQSGAYLTKDLDIEYNLGRNENSAVLLDILSLFHLSDYFPLKLSPEEYQWASILIEETLNV